MRSHELLLLLLRVYIAPAAEIVDKLCAQVSGFINLMFLGFLSPYDSYESQVSFESEGPKFLMEFHPHMCVLMLLIRNSAKVRHKYNPTRRLLVEICTRWCL